MQNSQLKFILKTIKNTEQAVDHSTVKIPLFQELLPWNMGLNRQSQFYWPTRERYFAPKPHFQITRVWLPC
jgi:hypothetical protein